MEKYKSANSSWCYSSCWNYLIKRKQMSYWVLKIFCHHDSNKTLVLITDGSHWRLKKTLYCVSLLLEPKLRILICFVTWLLFATYQWHKTARDEYVIFKILFAWVCQGCLGLLKYGLIVNNPLLSFYYVI